MQVSAPRWQFAIDTGGTFTDVIAHDPAGNSYRTKILSSGILRAAVLDQPDPNTLQLDAYWAGGGDLLSGYQMQIPDHDQAIQVEHWEAKTGLLRLAQALPVDVRGQDIAISSGEEAPILAARLITQTPLQQALPPMDMRLGSTKGTNALLERKGAKVAFLVTKGFADLLAIGTQARPELFALHIQKEVPLYEQVFEIQERLDAQGEVIEALTEAEIRRLVREVLASGCTAVAIACMHAYRNPVHEIALQQALNQAGLGFISCSHVLAPSIKLLPRAQTTVINAYLAPIIDRYLGAVQQALTEGQLSVMTSAGGLIEAQHFYAKDSLLSGPAGGIVGAATSARKAGIHRLLSFDMGGTSTDVARYDKAYDYRYEFQVGAARLLSPALAIETVAAGGGSICSFDGEKLTVGPDSAGASPGPACYGAGGPLTITDVNLLLGRIDPQHFGIPLQMGKAEQALQSLLAVSGLSRREVLEGFIRIANEKMAGAIRTISVQKGFRPKNHSLLSFGGAGGQHACQIAELLDISHILIPYDAAILSAYGIAQAIPERMLTRSVLLAYPAQEKALRNWVRETEQSALQSLARAHPQGQQPYIRATILHVRFQGQDFSLEIPYVEGQDLPAAFRQAYEHLFGHWPEEQAIEIAAITATAALRQAEAPTESSQSPRPYIPVPASYLQQVPVYPWPELQPGATLQGPALLISPYTSVYVATGWRLRLDPHGMAHLHRHEVMQAPKQIGQEAVQLELYTYRFQAIAEEMGALLQRTSFSVNVKERLDFSCALLDAKGELVVNAPHIPVHLGSLGVCVRKVTQALPLGPGDVAITNHPGFGGSHLPDITLIAPVYLPDGSLLAYVANRAHHAEIGGKRPGSMPPDAQTLAEEGVVIPPMKLVEGGQANWHMIEACLSSGPYPTRALAENLADLNAGLASLKAGEHALLKLCDSYGTSSVRQYMERLKAYAAQVLKRQLAALPAGPFTAQEFLDDGTPLQVRMSRHRDGWQIDFTGSGATHPLNLNANEAIVYSVVLYVLRLLCKQSIPLNEGLMQAISLRLPTGILNPLFPADPQLCPAVVGGNVETSQRLVDTLLKALGLAACSQGTMNNLLFGHAHFGYYETIGGGSGAGPGFAGADGVHQHMTNTHITDPEVLEVRYPVRLEQFAIRRGSGGVGKWSGGCGLVRQVRFLEPVSLTLLSQHRTIAPYGMAGGEAGQTGQQYLLTPGEEKKALPGMVAVEMEAGEAILIETPGGGGWGMP